MSKFNKFGFGLVEIVIVAGLLLAIAGVAYYVYDRNQNAKQTERSKQVKPLDSEEAPNVENAGDLKSADEYLDATDIDTQLNTSEIDGALE